MTRTCPIVNKTFDQFQESEPGTRVAFLVNPSSTSSDQDKAKHFAFLAALDGGLDVRTSLKIANEAKTRAPASIEQIKVTNLFGAEPNWTFFETEYLFYFFFLLDSVVIITCNV